MKQKAIVVGCYAILILIGGIIGYLVAHSVASLIASSVFTLLLLGCCRGIWKGHRMAYDLAIGIGFCLFLFFGYRFLFTYKLVPAGMMMILSVGLAIYLMMTRKQIAKISN